MAVRTITPPAVLLVLATALLAACGGADAQKSASAKQAVASARPGGDAAAPQEPAVPATPAQLQSCEDELKVQFANADTNGVTDGRTRVVPAALTDTGKAGKKAAPGAPAAPRKTYKTATDPGFAVKMGWPPKVPALLPGSILPCHRIVAYYGNPFSKKMGVLGEYPYPVMIQKFRQAVAMWNAADPKHPVQPALQLISVVAQGAPGADGMYRYRMPDKLIQQVYGWAKQEHAIFIMDVQVGGSTVQQELPRLEPYLKNPDVHLAIDPEFSMHYQAQGAKPGTKIGVMSAADVNFAIHFLESIAQKYHLPPKLLVVHRFTRRMVPDAEQIQPRSDVQVVMNMDGWGAEWLKRDSYRDYIVRHPVEYTGFKIFYHNDVRKPGWALMTPAQVLDFRPYPLYIQYQ